MLDDVTVETFRALIDAEFATTYEGGEVALVLVEVQPLGHGRGDARLPFSLLFQGPPAPLLPQATRAMTAQSFAAEIFIVPVAQDRRGVQYQAIFT